MTAVATAPAIVIIERSLQYDSRESLVSFRLAFADVGSGQSLCTRSRAGARAPEWDLALHSRFTSSSSVTKVYPR